MHAGDLALRLRALDGADPQYAGQFVDLVLDAAVSTAASDVHFQPSVDGLEVLLRVDGVLTPLGSAGARVTTRGLCRKFFCRNECGKQDLNLHEVTPTRPST